MDKDKLSQYYKEYRQKNKEKLSEQRKKCYENNKENILIKSKIYYESKKIGCKCGGSKKSSSKSCINCHSKKPWGSISRTATIKQLNKGLNNVHS